MMAERETEFAAMKVITRRRMDICGLLDHWVVGRAQAIVAFVDVATIPGIKWSKRMADRTTQ